jgi:histidinol-phosphatase
VPLSRDLRIALEAADAADTATMRRFRAPDLAIEQKADATPVSEADRAAETAIRDHLRRHLPHDAVLGEEYGAGDITAPRRWIVDPIDATVNYVRGVPVWASLIALEDADGIAVGVVSAPALGARWWAARGMGAWGDGRRMRVSAVDRIADAHLSINSIVTHEQQGLGPQITALSRRCARTRGFGDFWSFMLLAAGAVDLVVEPIAAVWDLAPLLVIVEEAGGRFTDFAGNRTIAGGNAAASNGRLHDALLEAMKSESQEFRVQS